MNTGEKKEEGKYLEIIDIMLRLNWIYTTYTNKQFQVATAGVSCSSHGLNLSNLSPLLWKHKNYLPKS
jgi:hypothetical protein